MSAKAYNSVSCLQLHRIRKADELGGRGSREVILTLNISEDELKN